MTDFHAGALDYLGVPGHPFRYGQTMRFNLHTRDRSLTFGSPLGARFVYVHSPSCASADTSTLALFPQRNTSPRPAPHGVNRCWHVTHQRRGAETPAFRRGEEAPLLLSLAGFANQR
jgi:hypothetical protein